MLMMNIIDIQIRNTFIRPQIQFQAFGGTSFPKKKVSVTKQRLQCQFSFKKLTSTISKGKKGNRETKQQIAQNIRTKQE